MRISLRLIEYKDIETLRVWRNENKEAFFYNELINKEEQIEWFKDYLKRDNRIYMVSYQDINIGCMGYRLFEESIEIYNVILGDKRYKRQGLMSEALQVLLKIIGSKVIIRIVKGNKAIDFYTKNGVGHDFSIRFKSR